MGIKTNGVVEMKANLLVAHGGAPSSVINASLYGVIREAQKQNCIESIYGAVGGVGGILEERFIDFRNQSSRQIDLLPKSPATAIGTSRKHLRDEDYDQIVKILLKNNIKYLLFNGGNGSMDTCGKIHKMASGHDIKVIGIPKTIDNDIAVTDHSPGFGSAARYLTVSVSEVAQDIKSMPIHVCIIEAMGRNAGWIAASSALARKNCEDAPHLIYLPERPFKQEEFLADVKTLYDRLGGVIVVASEGLKNENGEPIVNPILTRGRDVYFGDVGAHLATLVIKELGIKARSEKPGILGRASVTLQSNVDRLEAIRAGAFAVESAIRGKSGYMVGLERVSNAPYKCSTILIPIEKVMMHEKKIPDKYINTKGNDVTQDFIEYCRPLIGDPVPEYTDFKQN